MSEMRLRDYGYQTKKNDVLRERALTSAFREKGAGWVNKQMRNMLRVAREQESIILFKDMCNFIGSSPEEEIKKIKDEYEVILYNMVVHTKNYDFVHREFLNYAVIQIGWRNVCAWLENLKNNEKDEKVAEKIKKDMYYVIEVHSHRKKAMGQLAKEKEIRDEKQSDDEDDEEEDGNEEQSDESEEQSEEYKDLDDEDEEHGDDESISLRDYGYSVHKTQRGRIGALKRAVSEEGLDLVCERLEKLGKYHPVMLEDLKTLKPSCVVEPCCKCVSAEEIRTIVREELSKVFGEIKKMNEDIQKMYSEMIV